MLDDDESPIHLDNPEVRVSLDYPYTSHEDNDFDIFIPPSIKATPLVVFIHGGGFVQGHKEKVYQQYANEINQLLNENIAFATISYRFLSQVEKGVLDCMHDGKYFIQYIRHNAKSFNIDPKRIGAFGSSAGAGTSLWIGLNDDMRDKDADNPVLRQSTRLKAIGAFETQATYDILRWQEVFEEYTIDINRIPPILMNQFARFYGLKDATLLETPEYKSYRKKVDMLSLMSADDPPLFICNEGRSGAPLLNDMKHHPMHAKYLKKYADKVGIENVTYIPALEMMDSSGKSIVDFFVEHL